MYAIFLKRFKDFQCGIFHKKIVHPPAPTHNLQEDKDRYDDDDVQMVLYAVRAMPASLLSAQGQPSGVGTVTRRKMMLL